MKVVAKKQQFAVIGLGRFGGSVCKELVKLGNEVLAIDSDEQKVNKYTNIATHAVVADATDEKVLASLGIRNFEKVIVAIGDNIQASILTTLLLKEIGVENVCVKAKNNYHHKVLEKIGADKVVHPETDMGKRIAQQLSDENVIDYIELSDEFSIVELFASAKLEGKSLVELDIRARFGITILAIKNGEEINVSPEPEYKIARGDLLIVIGHNDDIKRFEDQVM
ncbi:potassium transporter Trk [Salipaludibacillus keqinensis]|uniref:Potassium transporter Trk n=1 Tax=Salipaludibacillus keqinensis TaxID=2045207 RepID=A0A323TIS0_9BACI|nr:TrkA family potassium uptake protein [Salipaludibacillus keqinensis]PYZ92563.1 potassium transporter Trk [Salipaludibacillus keqinensis]